MDCIRTLFLRYGFLRGCFSSRFCKRLISNHSQKTCKIPPTAPPSPSGFPNPSTETLHLNPLRMLGPSSCNLPSHQDFPRKFSSSPDPRSDAAALASQPRPRLLHTHPLAPPGPPYQPKDHPQKMGAPPHAFSTLPAIPCPADLPSPFHERGAPRGLVLSGPMPRLPGAQTLSPGLPFSGRGGDGPPSPILSPARETIEGLNLQTATNHSVARRLGRGEGTVREE